MVDVSVGVEKGCHWGWGWIQFDISKIKKETNDKYDFRFFTDIVIILFYSVFIRPQSQISRAKLVHNQLCAFITHLSHLRKLYHNFFIGVLRRSGILPISYSQSEAASDVEFSVSLTLGAEASVSFQSSPGALDLLEIILAASVKAPFRFCPYISLWFEIPMTLE